MLESTNIAVDYVMSLLPTIFAYCGGVAGVTTLIAYLCKYILNKVTSKNNATFIEPTLKRFENGIEQLHKSEQMYLDLKNNLDAEIAKKEELEKELMAQHYNSIVNGDPEVAEEIQTLAEDISVVADEELEIKQIVEELDKVAENQNIEAVAVNKRKKIAKRKFKK